MSAAASDLRAFRGSILHCLDDPGSSLASDAVEFFEDGLLVVENGRVQRVGEAATLLAELSADLEVTDHTGRLMCPVWSTRTSTTRRPT